MSISEPRVRITGPDGRPVDQVRALAEAIAARIRPYAELMDEEEAFAPEVLELLEAEKVWRSVHGDSVGSAALGDQCRWIEAIATSCTSTAVLVQSQLTVAHTLELSGTAGVEPLLDEMREGVIWGWGLTEPEAGSDILSMSTTARREGSDFVLRGSKRFISNAGMSRYYLVFARTSTERNSRSLSAFVVPAESEGLTVARYESKMGLRASRTGDLALDDVRVPASALVGEVGAGFGLAINTLRWSRPLIGAVSLGVARGAFAELAAQVAPDAEALRRLGDQEQGRGHQVADLLLQLTAASALLYEVADRADTEGVLPPMWRASAAKAFCSDTAMRIAGAAVELAGPGAAAEGSRLGRYFRDAKVLQIFEGTNQIQKNAIVRELLEADVAHLGTARI